MRFPFTFNVNAEYTTRQLDLETDQPMIGTLGERCVDYLRFAGHPRLSVDQAAATFLETLRPKRVLTDRGHVLGIWPSPEPTRPEVTALTGVLYFLHSHLRFDRWFISLLLLEPTARSRGLGSDIHQAFTQWAGQRGASRMEVAVLGNNPRALHFRRDRLGYRGVLHATPWQGGRGCRNQQLELWLRPAVSSAPGNRSYRV